MKAIHSNLSAPAGVNGRHKEPSRGALTLKSIREELRRVRELMKYADSDELREREKELVELEKRYSIYGKRFGRILRTRHRR
jgi:hypothetical protein